MVIRVVDVECLVVASSVLVSIVVASVETPSVDCGSIVDVSAIVDSGMSSGNLPRLNVINREY